VTQARIELFFDVACPYAYLASTQLEGLVARTGADLSLRPMLLGGLFREIGQVDDPNRAMSDARVAHGLRDLARWAERFGAPLRMPAAHPRRTVLAMRAITAADEPTARACAMHALFAAYWVRAEDVAQPSVVRASLERAGLDGARLLELAGTASVKEQLFATTHEAAERGVFGVPTFFVGRDGSEPEMFWGQDRLDWVEEHARS